MFQKKKKKMENIFKNNLMLLKNPLNIQSTFYIFANINFYIIISIILQFFKIYC